MPRPPAYRQIADDIERKIKSGELKPGDQLPSISTLAATYRAGQTTVKSALARLETLGLTEGQQGKGVFVAGAPPSSGQTEAAPPPSR